MPGTAKIENPTPLQGCLIIAGFILLIPLLMVGVAAVAAVLLMWGWGLFVTPIFGLPLLSFGEAFGAMVILTIIRFYFITGALKGRK